MLAALGIFFGAYFFSDSSPDVRSGAVSLMALNALVVIMTLSGPLSPLHSSFFLMPLTCVTFPADTPLASALFTFLWGRLMFFFSGHRMEFGSLQFFSGLVGMESFEMTRAGIQLGLNTLGYELISFLITASRQSKQNCKFFFIIALLHRMFLLTCCCCVCMVLSRHLMIWTVFAPKLVFESVIFLVHSMIYVLYFLTSLCEKK